MKYGLYIHLPFCRRKCHYCSFVSVVNAEMLMEPYTDALCSEINLRRTGIFSGNPHTLYIGGGTPSIVPDECIMKLAHSVSLKDAVECTVEANPDSLSEKWLETMLRIGINRVSIGIQSFDDDILALLGRLHTAGQAFDSVALARRTGFKNLSVDLMFGVPGQTMHMWKDTLDKVIGLGVEHISCYSLSIEEDSDYFVRASKSRLDLPDADKTTDMYFFCAEFLNTNGFNHYEISNFSLPGYECKHNCGYWDFTPYLGVGVAAHSFDGYSRRWNVCDPKEYIKLIESSTDPVQDCEMIGEREKMLEQLMLSLRVSTGLNIDVIKGSLGIKEHSFLKKIDSLVLSGLMEYNTPANVKLTVSGMAISEEIYSEIAADFY